jgi:DNA mismatch repair protein MutL
MTYIRVTDNGCGIAANDVKTAFLRHATSKLREPEGLEAIGTLGFRGEALAAIAAVSRIESRTCEHGAEEGIALVLEAGKVVDMSPVGCPEGTTMVVRDLFFNTPARQKFMKSDRAESSSVAATVLRCALSRPDVSIRFIRDGKAEYHTPGDSRLDSCIYSLLGREFSSGLLNAESSDEAISVTGFVCMPSAARGNRSYQFFFVNGRPIRSIVLQAALEQAYKNTLPSGRFPSCVLHITTKPGYVDVNVHPAKTEVKFISDKQVFDGVYYAALGAIERGRSTEDVECRIENVGFGNGRASYDSDGFKTMQVGEYRNEYHGDTRKKYNLDGAEPRNRTDNAQIGSFAHAVPNSDLNVWFIDKHAAHERLLFDKLRSGEHVPMSEALIMPVICRLGHAEASLLLENSEFLDNLGFSIESFGEDALAVRYIPAEIDIGDTESVLSDMCSGLNHGGTAEPAGRDNIFKIIACKAAIKAGRSSDSRELEALAAKVISGEVSHCPHGRPVAFEITKMTLDKGFKRI